MRTCRLVSCVLIGISVLMGLADGFLAFGLRLSPEWPEAEVVAMAAYYKASALWMFMAALFLSIPLLHE